jgi:hypothetical protein
MKPLFKNNAATKLRTALTAVATSVEVTISEGDKFPNVGPDEFFMVTVLDPATGDSEIMRVTARASDTFTVQRAQEGTSAKTFPIGALVQARVTAELLEAVRDAIIKNVRLDTMPAATFKANATAGTAAPTDITAAQAAAMLPTFTEAAKGLVPAPGAEAAKFLRDDGTWQDPPGADSSVQTVTLAAAASLPNHRVLATETGVLTVTDGGAAGNATIGVAERGISFPKIQAIATARLLGRNTAGSGDVEELTATTVKAMLGVAIADVTGLQSALDAKAAITYVDTGLGTKVNTSTFTTYQGTVTAALDAKVDDSEFATYQTTVTNALAGKVATTTYDAFVTSTNTALASKANTTDVQALSEKGVANGYASLDSGGKVPSSQLPSTSIANAAGVPFTPVGNIAATNVQDALTEVDNEKVPTTRTVAGKALSANITLAKGDVGLGNVDNTSDTAKPVSTAQQAALDLKANLAGATFTGNVTVTKSEPRVMLNKTASGQENGLFGYTLGVARWSIIPGDSAAESGSNAGSHFIIARYADNGALLGSDFKHRQTGDWTFEKAIIRPLQPHMRADRRINNWETLTAGAHYGVLGSFSQNTSSLFTVGAGRSSGNDVVVPYTGYYLMNVKVYKSATTTGRLHIAGTVSGDFNFITLSSSQEEVVEWTGIVYINAGEAIYWRVGGTNVTVYAAPGHTEISLYLL